MSGRHCSFSCQVVTMPAKPPKPDTRCFDIFVACTTAIENGELITKVSASDKEYHFQNWFEERLDAEDFDCNCQVPTGVHNGRTVFYVCGRYPDDVARTEKEYPLLDLVVCHGDFLNADHTYV